MFNKNVNRVLLTILMISGLSLINNDTKAQTTAVSTGVPFLLIGPNARFSGMGETGTAIADDATAMHWNPSGLAFQDNAGTEVNFTHSPWLAGLGIGDLFYDYLAGKKYVKSLHGTIGASLTYLNIGEVIFTDEQGNGNEANNYKAYELAFALAYATKLSPSLGVGITSRFIYSRLSPNAIVGNEQGKGTAFSTSFDLSMLWRPKTGAKFLKDRFSLGVNLSNLGPKISYVDAAQADPIPTQLRLGLAYQVVKSEFNNLTIATDFSKLLVHRFIDANGVPQSDPFYKAIFTSFQGNVPASIQTSIGAEYWYGKPKLIALRAGYFYEDPSNGNRKFITLGAGIKYSIYGFDFSYINTIEENHPLANTLRFGLNVGF